MPTDLALLDAWRAGDAAAGQELFRRHFAGACRFFYNKVDDGVEDLIQQTFLACVESRDRFRGDASFFTFLIGVAKNILRVHYRKKRRDERVDFGTMSVCDFSPSPSRVAADRADQQRLIDSLRLIPLDFQIALELHYWEEMSATQIAAALEIPVGTAKSRLRRGRELLRVELGKVSPETSLPDDDSLDATARSVRALLPRPPGEVTSAGD